MSINEKFYFILFLFYIQRSNWFAITFITEMKLRTLDQTTRERNVILLVVRRPLGPIEAGELHCYSSSPLQCGFHRFARDFAIMYNVLWREKEHRIHIIDSLSNLIWLYVWGVLYEDTMTRDSHWRYIFVVIFLTRK